MTARPGQSQQTLILNGGEMRRECAVCSAPFDAIRPQAKYCGDTCRKRAQRGGIAGPVVRVEVERPPSGLVDTVRAALEAAGRVDTIPGQHALELANRIVNAPGMNTGVAALSTRLSAVVAEALRNSAQSANPLDELRARRDRKRRSG